MAMQELPASQLRAARGLMDMRVDPVYCRGVNCEWVHLCVGGAVCLLSQGMDLVSICLCVDT